MNEVQPLRAWRIYTLDAEPPSEGRRHQKACLHLIFDIQQGYDAKTVTFGQLIMFARDVRAHRTADEVFLDDVFPADGGRPLPHDDDRPLQDHTFWGYLGPLDALEPDVVEGEEQCVLRMRYSNAEHPDVRVECSISWTELREMAAQIKAWIAPDGDF